MRSEHYANQALADQAEKPAAAWMRPVPARALVARPCILVRILRALGC